MIELILSYKQIKKSLRAVERGVLTALSPNLLEPGAHELLL